MLPTGITPAVVLTVAGLAFQILGGYVVLRGLIKTHDAYADKTIATLTREGAERWRARVAATLRRLFRRGGVVVLAGSADATLTMTGKARATVIWGPLPAKTAEAVRELDRRTRDLSKRLDQLDVRVENLDEGGQEALKALRSDLETAADQANQQVRHAAIEGLMREAVGLFLVTVGGVLQAWGTLAA